MQWLLMFSIYSGPPEDFNFDGYVEIYVTCNKATDKLYLHMNQLEMDNSTIMFRAVDDNDTPPGEYPIKHMSHFSHSHKMRCPLNLVLENWEYLWFYWTFRWWIETP